MPEPEFRKSSFCANGQCVEVAPLARETFLVRDSKDLTTVLTYSLEEWRAFVQGVKAGEFDFDLFPRTAS